MPALSPAIGGIVDSLLETLFQGMLLSAVKNMPDTRLQFDMLTTLSKRGASKGTDEATKILLASIH